MRESTAKLRSDLGINRHYVDQDVQAIENRVEDIRDRVNETRMRIYNSSARRVFSYVYSRFRNDPVGYLMLGGGLLRLSRRTQLSRMKERTMDISRGKNHPVLFAGLGVMIGSILAMAFRETRQERENIEPLARRIQNRAAEKAKEQIHKVTESMK